MSNALVSLTSLKDNIDNYSSKISDFKLPTMKADFAFIRVTT